jgi:hypothetical protein
VVHEFKIGIKIFAARLEAHQKINITLRMDSLITRKRSKTAERASPIALRLLASTESRASTSERWATGATPALGVRDEPGILPI